MRSVLFLVLAAGCAGPDSTAIERTFDVCQPIGLDARGATAAQHEGVADAIALWRELGVTTLVAGSLGGEATIPILFEDASPAFHGYYDDETGAIFVNRDLDDAPGARAIVLAHELGHAFGLPHVAPEERVSLMNPANLTVPPSAEDARELELRWGPCAPAP